MVPLLDLSADKSERLESFSLVLAGRGVPEISSDVACWFPFFSDAVFDFPPKFLEILHEARAHGVLVSV